MSPGLSIIKDPSIGVQLRACSRILWDGVKYRNKVQDLLAPLSEKTQDKEVHRLLKQHAGSALSLSSIQDTSKYMGRELSPDVARDCDALGMYVGILWSNLDKILDHESVSDQEFFAILQHYYDMVIGISKDEGTYKHPKFRELELIASGISEIVSRLPGKELFLELFELLYSSVCEQRKGVPLPRGSVCPRCLSQVNSELESYDDLTSVEKDWIFLSQRLGITSAILAGGTPYFFLNEFSEKDHETFEALLHFGATAQLIDDFTDVDEDLKNGKHSFMTLPGTRVNRTMFVTDQRTRNTLAFPSSGKSLRIITAVRDGYKILSRFAPKDNGVNLPYGINELKR